MNISKSNPIFAVRSDNVDFLRYFFYANQFEHSKVTYTFGEVKLETDEGTFLIHVKHTLDTVENKFIQGSPSIGICTDLQELSRTETFTIPDNGNNSINFYRLITESWDLCNSTHPDPDTNGNWDIADKTEFVLQMIEDVNGAVLSVIDSVVSMPNNNPNADSLFGTNPYVAFHNWNIPQSLNGKKVYLRVSPRRYGQTAYGLTMKELKSWVDFASIVDSSGIFLGLENQNYLDSLCWIEDQNILNDAIQNTGHLPTTNYFIPPKYENDYKQLYLSQLDYDIINGDTIYYEMIVNNSQSFHPSAVGYYKNNTLKLLTNPNPVIDNKLKLKIECKINLRAKINLISIARGTKNKIWQGGLTKGINELAIDIKNFPNGSYILNLRDSEQRYSITDKISITR